MPGGFASRAGQVVIAIIALVLIVLSGRVIIGSIFNAQPEPGPSSERDVSSIQAPNATSSPAALTDGPGIDSGSSALSASAHEVPLSQRATNSKPSVPSDLPLTQENASSSGEIPDKTAVASTSAAQLAARAPKLIPTETLNAMVRPAVVNIYCLVPTANGLSPVTASGVFVSSRGVILTNAHVGQYFLLARYRGTDFVECQIRTGNPARAAYTARLLYISPEWIKDNASDITETNPKGTGQNDFALLLVTGTADGSRAPAAFPALAPQASISAVFPNTPVLIASYPAGFLGTLSIADDLNLVSTVSTIDRIFSFEPDLSSIDLLSFKGSIDSQQGSSGGAVASFGDSSLLGIVVTSTLDGSTGARELRAVTVQHIEKSFMAESGQSLSSFLAGNLTAEANAFADDMEPELSAILFSQIEKQ